MMYLLIVAPLEIAFLLVARYRREAVQKAVEKVLDLGLDDP